MLEVSKSTKPNPCKQPYWSLITELCKSKIEEQYPKYGNGWKDMQLNSSWNERIQQELDEVKMVSGFDQDKRIEELIDVINVCAMDISNLLDSRQREKVMMRLGL